MGVSEFGGGGVLTIACLVALMRQLAIGGLELLELVLEGLDVTLALALEVCVVALKRVHFAAQA